MADILIRGMEMPEDCDKCKLCALIPVGMYGLYRKCTPLNRNAKITVRRKDCPLQELPEHGDLISKDDAMNAILGEPPEAHYPSWYASIVNEIPAIVPSNKEETK